MPVAGSSTVGSTCFFAQAVIRSVKPGALGPSRSRREPVFVRERPWLAFGKTWMEKSRLPPFSRARRVTAALWTAGTSESFSP